MTVDNPFNMFAFFQRPLAVQLGTQGQANVSTQVLVGKSPAETPPAGTTPWLFGTSKVLSAQELLNLAETHPSFETQR